MSLTDTAIRHSKARSTPYKVTDGGGLHLLVQPHGAKLWRLSYRFAGRQKTLALGVYPTVTLLQARERRDAAKRLLADGVDPSEHRKAEKRAILEGKTFAELADEWRKEKVQDEGRAERTIERTDWLLRVLKGELGTRPAAQIEPPELLEALRKTQALGHYETVARLRSTASRIFRYGIAKGVCRRDAAADLRGALTTPTVQHRPAILDPTGIGALMRAIDDYPNIITRAGLRLLAYTFVRPGELRFAEWSEFDLDAHLWSIPAFRTKMRRDHLVPLSQQALEVLKELRPITGADPFVLPSPIHRGRPLSENTLNLALRRIGYGADEMVAHGFRAMASTRLREMNRWPVDVIERQLAHVEGNSVRAAYNRAELLPQRVELMDAWGDYLDQLRDRGRLVPLADHRAKHTANKKK